MVPFYLGCAASTVSTPTMTHFNSPSQVGSLQRRCFLAVEMPLVNFAQLDVTFALLTDLAGGQAFMIKLRKTTEGSPTSMVIEPPHELLGKDPNPEKLSWRYLKYEQSFASVTRAWR